MTYSSSPVDANSFWICRYLSLTSRFATISKNLVLILTDVTLLRVTETNTTWCRNLWYVQWLSYKEGQKAHIILTEKREENV